MIHFAILIALASLLFFGMYLFGYWAGWCARHKAGQELMAWPERPRGRRRVA